MVVICYSRICINELLFFYKSLKNNTQKKVVATLFFFLLLCLRVIFLRDFFFVVVVHGNEGAICSSFQLFLYRVFFFSSSLSLLNSRLHLNARRSRERKEQQKPMCSPESSEVKEDVEAKHAEATSTPLQTDTQQVASLPSPSTSTTATTATNAAGSVAAGSDRLLRPH